eukprot:scaffold102754_cov63-Phaeocystis_antarctica.AAC.2
MGCGLEYTELLPLTRRLAAAHANVQVPCRQHEQQARAVVPRLERAVHVADQRVRVRLALRELLEQRAAWRQSRTWRQRSQQDVLMAPSSRAGRSHGTELIVERTGAAAAAKSCCPEQRLISTAPMGGSDCITRLSLQLTNCCRRAGVRRECGSGHGARAAPASTVVNLKGHGRPSNVRAAGSRCSPGRELPSKLPEVWGICRGQKKLGRNSFTMSN